MGNLEEGSSLGDFECWRKGSGGRSTLSLSLSLSLSLQRLRGGGTGGSSFTVDPGRYAKKISGYGHLSPWGPLSIRGDPGIGGGAQAGDFDRRLKEGSSSGASLCEGVHEGDHEGGFIYWGTRKMRFLRYVKNAL